ncbi:aminodeoxychorismate synthase component I [Chryseobacterium sp.]|uniref:aminodeoxychorismate synthase component I n=1 Tax=Chryseobacterium sp. TaxID=1871047 RepID=UPI0011CC29A5|nr:aminodeoxychorismate synthase component I [Chryseobacterium sp.]TXF75948.1 aminodeoxychorismate synthase component I [Chryseobacterium sp.]
MTKKAEENFSKMDELSLQEVPFFFMINFQMEEVRIFKKNEITNSGLLIDFKSFTNTSKGYATDKQIHLKSFPQSVESYKEGFDLVQKNLKLGNSYLANYTCKTEIESNLTLKEIFHLSQAKFKVLYKDEFVCFSPETFIEVTNNKVFTHPMKGTIDAAENQAAETLKNDVKEKAEHYTVVDLLRNDLSMVADNVKVDEFQRIDLIRTQQKDLYAMSSEISGDLKPEFRGKIGSMMKELLPAGSILGAPKRKTLEIILKAENYQRGFYTGISGWFDGKNLDSCVMIRFIEKENGKLYFKSGGGITHLSKLADEYQEMKNKIYVPIY